MYHYLKRKTHNKTEVIQKAGERMAVQSTFSQNTGKPPQRPYLTPTKLFRANVRSETAGIAGERRLLMNHLFHEWYLETFKDTFDTYYAREHQRPFLKQDVAILAEAECIRQLGSAICDDFAAVTYAHLIEHTVNQWVYRCSLTGTFETGNRRTILNPNHSFTITSPTPLQIVQEKLSGNTQSGLDAAIVVDAWMANTVLSLPQFMNRNNPYDGLLSQTNIYVNERQMANGFEMLTNDDRRYIIEQFQIFLDNFNQRYEAGQYHELLINLRSGSLFGEEQAPEIQDMVNDLRLDNSADIEFENSFGTYDSYFTNELYVNLIQHTIDNQRSYLNSGSYDAYRWQYVKKLLYTNKPMFLDLYSQIRNDDWFQSEFEQRFTTSEINDISFL